MADRKYVLTNTGFLKASVSVGETEHVCSHLQRTMTLLRYWSATMTKPPDLKVYPLLCLDAVWQFAPDFLHLITKEVHSC